MINAAGIILVDGDDRALFLKRGPGGDHAGEWCFPGGRLEDGETVVDAAIRETEEESGFKADASKLLPWTRSVSAAGGAPLPIGGAPAGTIEQVDFTTFLLKGVGQFVPDIDKSGEHVAYAWCPLNAPPEPLHPGCRVALERFTMDELGIARAIRDGLLTSPQKYENVWLFDMRITGTGTAYRSKIKEFVYRRPENYLNPEFLARCNGLQVIWLHPEQGELDSKEFATRTIGAMMLPYIDVSGRHSTDEVWGIAKIYDDNAVQEMMERQLSTSPMVMLRGGGDSKKITLEDGSKLLIEGGAGLCDHLAVCEHGVWDKGGEPSGIIATGLATGATMADMTEDEKAAKAKADAEEKEREDKKKADAEMSGNIDKLLKGVDALCSRMDSFEKFRKDSEEREEKRKTDAMTEEERKAEDKKRKDAEEEKKKADAEKEEEEKRKADAQKLVDAATAPLSAKIAEIDALLPRQMTDADHHAMMERQAHADEAYSAFGERAPIPLRGETPEGYSLRTATHLKQHSKTWKGIDLSKLIGNADAFAVAEKQIYADAALAAANPIDLQPGQLRAIPRRGPGGREIIEFVGNGTFIRGMTRPARRVAAFNTQKGN